MFDKMESGKRIAYLLSLKGFKQKELALRMGVTDNMPSYWVHGKRQPTLEQYAEMASIFECSVDYLLALSDDPIRCPTLVDELGLSEQAVSKLRCVADDDKLKAVFNSLFESDHFYCLVSEIASMNEQDRGM